MTYAELTDDELRLEVAKRCGFEDFGIKRDGAHEFLGADGNYCYINGRNYEPKLPDYPRDVAAAIALLEETKYPDGLSVEYVILKETYSHIDEITPLAAPVYFVQILARNPVSGRDYEATADTLPRAACLAWLAWKDK